MDRATGERLEIADGGLKPRSANYAEQAQSPEERGQILRMQISSGAQELFERCQELG
jgi:hypothetical protein